MSQYCHDVFSLIVPCPGYFSFQSEREATLTGCSEWMLLWRSAWWLHLRGCWWDFVQHKRYPASVQLWYVQSPHIPQHFSGCCLTVCLCCSDASTVLPEHTSAWHNIVLPAVHSTITPVPSQVPPLHSISCLIWLVDYSQHETQWLFLRHIQNSTAGLSCYFSLAPSVLLLQLTPCTVDSLTPWVSLSTH